MSFITDHCGGGGGVSPVSSFTLFTVLLDASLTDGQAMCVKQFSSDLILSGHVFSSAIDASAPDDLRGVGLSGFLVRFRLFAMFRFHVIFLIWWIISGSSLPRNIISMLVTGCPKGLILGRIAQRRCLD